MRLIWLTACAVGVAVVSRYASAAWAAIAYSDLYTITVPAGFSSKSLDLVDYSQIAAGGQVIGYATTTDGYHHATLWDGNGTPTDLNPDGGYTGSTAYGISGGQQVGTAYGPATQGVYHAFLWNGTKDGIDLNPASGVDATRAYAVGDGQQVGYGIGPATGNGIHAFLWNGTNAAIDLNPGSGISHSEALGLATASKLASCAAPRQVASGTRRGMEWNKRCHRP